MTFQKKERPDMSQYARKLSDIPETPLTDTVVENSDEVTEELLAEMVGTIPQPPDVPEPVQDVPQDASQDIETFARFDANAPAPSSSLCTVLHGYGIDPPNLRRFIDNYEFVGGVGRNIPRNVANAWKDGKRWLDKKPAISRVYLQAILPADATEVMFAKATGVLPLSPKELASMIGATDAKALVQALGRKEALTLAQQLMKNSTE